MYTEITKTRKTDQLFNLILTIQQLDLSRCLKIILDEKGIEIMKLHQMIQDRGYLISRESLYRYFNPSVKSRRFPPLEFIEVFAIALNFSHQETELLKSLWFYCRLIKKCNKKINNQLVSINSQKMDKSNFPILLDNHDINL